MTLEDKESLKNIITEANNILMQLQQDLSAVACSRLDLFCRFIIVCVYCLQFFFALLFCNKEKQWDTKRHLKNCLFRLKRDWYYKAHLKASIKYIKHIKKGYEAEFKYNAFKEARNEN